MGLLNIKDELQRPVIRLKGGIPGNVRAQL